MALLQKNNSQKKLSRSWIKATVFLALTAFAVLGLLQMFARAGVPQSAYYSPANDRLFWFIQISDIHMGTSGSQDSNYLSWVVNTGRSVINPEFIVATGDLTDSTNGNFLGYPNGPYQEEWDEYRAILDAAGMDASFYYDIPGNHDAYNDQFFTYYLANSIQGQATGQTQISWTRTFPFGKYHFLGVNSSDNTGDPFSLFWPWGDYAGLDTEELSFISTRLQEHSDADLTLVFGHHPVTDTGVSDDTWLYYGHEEFMGYLDTYRASLYGFGHTHRYDDTLFAGNGYTGIMSGPGIDYLNIASLGKSGDYHYSVIAIDCNGLSSVTQAVNTWPVVLITAPVDRYLGTSPNPYAYTVPNSSTNPIRALVFDAGSVSQVQYRIDGEAAWFPMYQAGTNPALWEASWDASGLAPGEHSIEVQASGTSVRSDVIHVVVEGSPVNTPPQAVNDAYSVNQNEILTVAPPGVLGNDSDGDGDPLTAVLTAGVSHGSLALSPDGSFSYTPAVDFSGTDSFAYAANDGTENSAAAVVQITVDPVAGDDTVAILAAVYNPKPKRLLVEATSSAQPEAVLTVVGYGQMTYSAADGRYTFNQKVTVPPDRYVTVTSDHGGSDVYDMNGGTNAPPTAFNQNVSVTVNQAKAIALTADDPDGDPLTFIVLTLPTHGILSGSAPNLQYAPDADYTGTDSFTFKANDGTADSNTAVISITVSEAAAETVTILKAEYKVKAKQFLVEATSSLQPDAVLTLIGFGEMTYDAAAGKYIYQAKVSQNPGETVTVTSSLGGSDTAPVTLK